MENKDKKNRKCRKCGKELPEGTGAYNMGENEKNETEWECVVCKEHYKQKS